MNRKTVSGIMLTLLLTGMLAWAFDVQPAKVSASISEAAIRDAIVDNANQALGSHYLMGSRFGTEGEKPNDGTGWGGKHAGRWPFGLSEVILDPLGKAWAPFNGASATNPCIKFGICEDMMHFDCSGLVFWAYTNWNGYGSDTGIWVGRMKAVDYFTRCDNADWSFTDLNLADKGDLLFTSDKKHVGIVTDPTNHKVVHASSTTVEVKESTYKIPSDTWKHLGDLVNTILEENKTGSWSHELWRIIECSAEAQMVKLLNHYVDAVGEPSPTEGPTVKMVGDGIPRPEDIATLEAAGYTTAKTSGFSMGFYAINNRVPPLNDQVFRTALAYCVDKETMYDELYGSLVTPIYNWAPPAQAFWCNPDIDLNFPRFNLQIAIDILIGGGYWPVLIDPGSGAVPGNIDHWNMPGTTTPIRDLEQAVPVESTLGTRVSEWLEGDMQSIGLPVCHTSKPFNNIVYEEWLAPPYLGWDLTVGMELTFGVDPVLSEMYHVDAIPAFNIWGLDDATVNAELEAYRETLDWDVAQAHAFAAEERLLELMPMIPMIASNKWSACAGSHDGAGVLGWANMLGYGGYNIWSALYSRREYGYPVGGEFANWLLGQDANILNPLTSDTAYEWALMEGVYQSLYITHPYTHQLLPWCVTDYPVIQKWTGTEREVSPGVWVSDPSPIGSPGAVIGEYMRWTLRDDMTWHDGTPVTSADVEFCLDLLVNQNNERYDAIQRVIHDVEIISEYVVDVYMTARYLWADNDISHIALLAPRHIWKPYIAGPDGDLWTGDDRDHRFWKGYLWTDAYGYSAPVIVTVSGSVQLTHLQGNGPFVYPDGGWVPDTSMRLIRWRIGSWHEYAYILRGDNNFDGYVDVLDLWAPAYAFGSQPGMPRWLHRADMANPAGLIDGRDIAVVYDEWGLHW